MPEQITCPVARNHHVGHEWEQGPDGMRTGRLLDWCFTCDRPLPVEPPAAFDRRDRAEHARHADRNALIRELVSAGMHVDAVATRVGLSASRIRQLTEEVRA